MSSARERQAVGYVKTEADREAEAKAEAKRRRRRERNIKAAK